VVLPKKERYGIEAGRKEWILAAAVLADRVEMFFPLIAEINFHAAVNRRRSQAIQETSMEAELLQRASSFL
jgi:hypothetical protein